MIKAMIYGSVLAIINVFCQSLWYALSLLTVTTFLFPVLIAVVSAFLTVLILKLCARGNSGKTIAVWVALYIVLSLLSMNIGLNASNIYNHFYPEYSMGANDSFSWLGLSVVYLIAYWAFISFAISFFDWLEEKTNF